MSLIFSGSCDYPKCEMFYAMKDSVVIRLEIYIDDAQTVTEMYSNNGYSVTHARNTPTEVSSSFKQLHQFKPFNGR